jgi:mRNA interferase RelE/StbE
MNWTVEVKGNAAKSITRLDKLARNRITGYLRQLEALDNPRSQGKALTRQVCWLMAVPCWRLPFNLRDKGQRNYYPCLGDRTSKRHL